MAFVKVPVPLDVHVIPELLVDVAPVVIFTGAELEQVFMAVPADAVGAAVIVIVLLEVAFAQPALPTAVNTSVRLPAVISAVLGVYVAVVRELAFAKVPVPLDVVQVILALLVALDPAVIFTAPVVEQVTTAVPATAVGAWLMVNVLFDVAFAAQGEFGVAVNVSVTLPAEISAALGV